MCKIPDDMKAGSIHETNNCGEIEVLNYNGWDSVEIKFINTGHVQIARSERVRNGMVKDPFHRTVYGVGFIGVGRHSGGTGKAGVHDVKYQTWSGMFKRCYGPDYPSYLECSVHPEWHNFQNFAGWYEDNHPKDGLKYDLDKDIKVEGNKVYGPDTCIFVDQALNKQKAKAKKCRMTNPDGVVIEINNVKKFCRDNNLLYTSFNEVTLGRLKSYKGWKLTSQK